MRKTESIILSVLSWIHAVLLFAGLYLVVPTIMEEFSKGIFRNLIPALVLFIPVILSFFMLRKIRNIFLYLLVSAGITVLIFAVTGKVLTMVLSGLIFLIRCRARIEMGKIRKQMRDFPGGEGRFLEPEAWEIPTLLDKPKVYQWGFFLFEYFLIIFSGKTVFLKGIFYLLAMEMLITFCHQYIDNMKNFVLTRQKIANLPTRMILRNGYVIFAGLLMIALVSLAPAILWGKEPLTGLYRESHPLPPVTFELEQPAPEPNLMMEMLMEIAEEQPAPPQWLLFLNKVFSVLILAGVLFFSIRFLLYEFSRMAGAFAEEEEDEIIDLRDAEEEQKKLRREQRRKEREQRHTATYRIRKKYKKRILKHSKRKPLGAETPQELERKAKLEEKSDNQLIHAIYEKARYSKEGGSTEDEKAFPD